MNSILFVVVIQQSVIQPKFPHSPNILLQQKKNNGSPLNKRIEEYLMSLSKVLWNLVIALHEFIFISPSESVCFRQCAEMICGLWLCFFNGL